MWCHWWRHYYIMPPPNLPSMYHKECCWERQSPNATKLYVPSSIYFIIKQYIFYRVAYVLYIKLIFWVKSHVMVTSNGVSHFTKRLCWRLKAHKLLCNKGVFFPLLQLRLPIECKCSQVCYFKHNVLGYTKCNIWSLTILPMVLSAFGDHGSIRSFKSRMFTNRDFLKWSLSQSVYSWMKVFHPVQIFESKTVHCTPIQTFNSIFPPLP